jgi:hypothetical protein
MVLLNSAICFSWVISAVKSVIPAKRFLKSSSPSRGSIPAEAAVEGERETAATVNTRRAARKRRRAAVMA